MNKEKFLTIWKDGSYKIQSQGDDYYSRNDKDWLVSINLKDIKEEETPNKETK